MKRYVLLELDEDSLSVRLDDFKEIFENEIIKGELTKLFGTLSKPRLVTVWRGEELK